MKSGFDKRQTNVFPNEPSMEWIGPTIKWKFCLEFRHDMKFLHPEILTILY